MKNFGIPFLTFALIFGVVSCKKNGCTDSKALNFDIAAEKEDGSCTYVIDQLLGTYTVNQDCSGTIAAPYSITVIAGGFKDEIIIQNLYNEYDVKATIVGSNFSFKEDKAGVTVEGSGYSVGGTGMTINMQLCETYYYPCSSPESCTLSCTK